MLDGIEMYMYLLTMYHSKSLEGRFQIIKWKLFISFLVVLKFFPEMHTV